MNGVWDHWYNANVKYGAIYSEISPVRDGLIVTADVASKKFAWAVLEVLEEHLG